MVEVPSPLERGFASALSWRAIARGRGSWKSSRAISAGLRGAAWRQELRYARGLHGS